MIADIDEKIGLRVCQVASVVFNSATLSTVAGQAPPTIGCSRQEYWSGLPCPPPGDLPNPGIESTSPASPALAGGFFTTSATRFCRPGFAGTDGFDAKNSASGLWAS